MSPLFAYIDPITGTLVYQLLVMAVVAVVIFFKKVKKFVLGLFGIKTTIASIENMEDTPTIPLDNNKETEQQKAA